jgi:hypothetical protein
MAAHPERISSGAPAIGEHERRLTLLKWILGFGIVSTGIHFTHNFVAIDRYPDDLVSGAVVRVAIVLFWPLFTALALSAYRLYARHRYREAHPLLLAYSFFALTTLGHFLDGSPDIAPFWFATIFTDALAGLAVLAFTISSMRSVQRGLASSKRSSPSSGIGSHDAA